MSDRLTRDGLREVLEYLEAHYPTARTKWKGLEHVYPTLAGYSDEVVMAAAKSYVTAGGKYMPGPVDLLAEAQQQVKARHADRIQVTADHPRGHVYEILDESAGMRRAECVLCGDTITRPKGQLVTAGEAAVSDADQAGD